jgi:hypothetical protein
MAKWTDEEVACLKENYGEKTCKEIAAVLGRSEHATRMKAGSCGLTNKDNVKKWPKTKCWTCQNAVPSPRKGRGCSWSISLEPVKGWTAKPTKLRAHNRQDPEIGSYQVLACPEYIPDKEKPKTRRLHRLKG